LLKLKRAPDRLMIGRIFRYSAVRRPGTIDSNNYPSGAIISRLHTFTRWEEDDEKKRDRVRLYCQGETIIIIPKEKTKTPNKEMKKKINKRLSR